MILGYKIINTFVDFRLSEKSVFNFPCNVKKMSGLGGLIE